MTMAPRRLSSASMRRPSQIGWQHRCARFASVVICLHVSLSVADDPRPVRQVESDDGVIELTNAKHAPEPLEIDEPEALPGAPVSAPSKAEQTSRALTPVAARRDASSSLWLILPGLAIVAFGAGWALRRRAKRTPKWATFDEPLGGRGETDRVSGPMEAISTLTPRERPSGGEPQWVSQGPRSRRAGS